MGLRNPFSRRPPAWKLPEDEMPPDAPAAAQPPANPVLPANAGGTDVGDDDPTTIKSRPPETGEPARAMDQSRPGDPVSMEKFTAAAAAGDQPMSRQISLTSTTIRPPVDDKPLRRGDVANPNLGAAMPVGDTSPDVIYRESDPLSGNLIKDLQGTDQRLANVKGMMQAHRSAIKTSKDELRGVKTDIKRRRAEQHQLYERELGGMQAKHRSTRKELEEEQQTALGDRKAQYEAALVDLNAKYDGDRVRLEQEIKEETSNLRREHDEEGAAFQAKQREASEALTAELKEAEDEYKEALAVHEGALANAATYLVRVQEHLSELKELAFFEVGDSYNRRSGAPPAMPTEPPAASDTEEDPTVKVEVGAPVASVAATSGGFEGSVPDGTDEDDIPDDGIVPGPTVN